MAMPTLCGDYFRTPVINCESRLDDLWLIRVDSIADVTNPSFDHAYVTPDDEYYALNHAGTELILINGDSGGGFSQEIIPVWLGQGSFTDIENATAIGVDVVVGNAAAGFGYRANAIGNYSLSMGYQSISSGANAVAIGNSAQATNTRSIAIGNNAYAQGVNTMAYGYNATATGANSISIGGNAKSNSAGIAIGASVVQQGQYGISIGTLSNASGLSPIAIGFQSQATGNNGLAIGTNSVASGNNGIALGDSAQSTQARTIAIGDNSASNAIWAIAIGYNAIARANASIGVGINSLSNGISSISIGQDSFAGSTSDIAIGTNATAAAGNSVAFGVDALNSTENSIRLGRDTLSELSCAVDLTVTSDARDKADIEKLETKQSLAFINNLDPVRYVRNPRTSYIDSEHLTEEELEAYGKYGLTNYDKKAHAAAELKGSRKRAGFLAQDVQKAMYSVYGSTDYINIVNDNFYDLKDKPEDIENRLSMCYNSLIPLMIGAIQELYHMQDQSNLEAEA